MVKSARNGILYYGGMGGPPPPRPTRAGPFPGTPARVTADQTEPPAGMDPYVWARKVAMVRAGITASAMARRWRVTSAHIYMLVNGQNRSRGLEQKFARLVGVPVGELWPPRAAKPPKPRRKPEGRLQREEREFHARVAAWAASRAQGAPAPTDPPTNESHGNEHDPPQA